MIKGIPIGIHYSFLCNEYFYSWQEHRPMDRGHGNAEYLTRTNVPTGSIQNVPETVNR